MTIKEWVDKVGRREAAKILGVDSSTLSNWCRGTRLPNVENLQAIYRASKGKVSYREMIETFASEKQGNE